METSLGLNLWTSVEINNKKKKGSSEFLPRNSTGWDSGVYWKKKKELLALSWEAAHSSGTALSD